MEFRVEDVISALEKENPLKNITNNIAALQSFNYYSETENVNNIINYIIECENERKVNLIKSLVKLYPMSENILSGVMNSITPIDMKNDMINWLDVSDTMSKSFNKFKTMCSGSQDFNDSKTELQSQIDALEKKKESFNAERENLRELKERHKELIAEVNALKLECDKLKSEASEENLRSEKEKIEKEIQKYKDIRNKAKSELKTIQSELKKEKDCKDEKLTDALKKLSAAIQALPEDEADK